ncbi:hypothetical protein D5S18_13240 [Nocardia panacis]|uniref:Uncharacterized protein n=1 Tax=Nocardia panacis TaxID=2340916 RepID=A0A3A4L470_9NOCA|nr:hypothetical protein [Nocardia panacis]RJO77123.1 hypothetical protein D5S18_13240 [Nocardia panacis]
MAEKLSVDLASVNGFSLDLRDLAANFSSNGSNQLSGLLLPHGASGLAATLNPALERLHGTLSSAQQRDIDIVNNLLTGLSTVADTYRATDDANANSLAAQTAALQGNAEISGGSAPAGITRYSGLQLPTLPTVEDERFVIRQVVTSAIDLISAYDDPWSRVIGIKPAADYLTQLVSDWEALRAIGKRIGFLGINDFVTAQNLSGGTGWLRAVWTGSAAESFGSTAGGLAQSVGARSNGLEAVAKIVEKGGALLERLVYNQAIGISGAITKPIEALGFTMPLGVWALRLKDPMDGSAKAQIQSAVDSLRQTAESTKTAITTTIDQISKALDYSPGQAAPTNGAADFEIPAKVVVDMGTLRYGFGNNVWFESIIGSIT